MKKMLLLSAAILLGGCSRAVPVRDLALPPVSIIEGAVTRLDQGGFTLQDNSGSIFVKAELPEKKPLHLVPDEQVRVYGNLIGGRERIFDGYVIRKQNGEQIMVSRPQPHFGFILQTSFE